MEEKIWCVYLLECLDGSFYTGITNDVENRMAAHKSGKGSKYVKHKGFARLIATKPCLNRSDATKVEYRIKQMSRTQKLDYFKLI